MESIYSSDKPLSNRNDDMLQRYPFARRIVDSIINFQGKDGIVIGIYGEWGEGKSTILSFIESDLLKESKILSIKFNPWRFKDENILLSQFFQKLSEKTKEKIISSGHLDPYWQNQFNKKSFQEIGESVGEALSKYSKVLSYVPGVGGFLGDSGESIGGYFKKDIDESKEEIEKYLFHFPGRIVVLIDDIDRLDKDEIFALFRLVKLSANFPNVTYILFFDIEMVASALENRFGTGSGRAAGYSFIEKIIQIPLKIPVANKSILKNYLFDLLKKIIGNNSITVSKKDWDRFEYNFDNFILPHLSTPRMIVRYANSVSFTLPLLKNEVNIGDLFVVEGLKVFYPTVYDLIRSNKGSFLTNFHRFSEAGEDTPMANSYREKQKIALDSISEPEKISMKQLLLNLFPSPKREPEDIFSDFDHEEGDNEFKGKRIYSPIYFDKYFSYVVSKGDISDVVFSGFIKSASSKELNEVGYELECILNSAPPEAFLQRIINIEEPISWEATNNLTKSICLKANSFPHNQTGAAFFRFESVLIQAVKFVVSLLQKSRTKGDVLSLAKDIIEKSQNIDFAYQIFRYLDGFEMKDTELFSADQLKELGMSLVTRSIQEVDEGSIFDLSFPLTTAKIFLLFNSINKEKALYYFESKLNKDAKQSLTFIKTYTPIYNSLTFDEFHSIDFPENNFALLKEVLEDKIDFLYEKMLEEYPESLQGEAIFFGDMGIGNNDENLLKQFVHWYKRDKSNTANSSSNVELAN